MKRYDPEDGIDDLSDVLSPVRLGEIFLDVPKSLKKKISMCRNGNLSDLARLGVIKSCETLANLAPIIAAAAVTGGIKDPRFRILSYAVSCAFSRRRSLLLLDMSSQVKLRDLPWFIESSKLEVEETLLVTLQEIVSTALIFFPQFFRIIFCSQ